MPEAVGGEKIGALIIHHDLQLLAKSFPAPGVDKVVGLEDENHIEVGVLQRLHRHRGKVKALYQFTKARAQFGNVLRLNIIEKLMREGDGAVPSAGLRLAAEKSDVVSALLELFAKFQRGKPRFRRPRWCRADRRWRWAGTGRSSWGTLFDAEKEVNPGNGAHRSVSFEDLPELLQNGFGGKIAQAPAHGTLGASARSLRSGSGNPGVKR